MSSKTVLIDLNIFRHGEKSIHGRPSRELAPYDCEVDNTKDVQCSKLEKNPGCPYGKCRTISGNRPFIFPKNWLPEQSFSCLGQPGNRYFRALDVSTWNAASVSVLASTEWLDPPHNIVFWTRPKPLSY